MNEIEAITKLERLCFENCWERSAIEAQMNNPCCVFVLWQEAEAVTGYALGNIVCDEAELYRIAVVPANRKTGTGTRILQRFIADCKKRGAKKIFLEVRSRNTAAVGHVRIRYVRGEDDVRGEPCRHLQRVLLRMGKCRP